MAAFEGLGVAVGAGLAFLVLRWLSGVADTDRAAPPLSSAGSNAGGYIVTVAGVVG